MIPTLPFGNVLKRFQNRLLSQSRRWICFSNPRHTGVYASGSKNRSALALNQNPDFQTASIQVGQETGSRSLDARKACCIGASSRLKLLAEGDRNVFDFGISRNRILLFSVSSVSLWCKYEVRV
jgi:hypothetical protein